MFDVTVVRTKAGHIGQVTSAGRILWESEPYAEEMVPSLNDRLLRSHDEGAEKACDAARGKIADVLEKLFQ